MLKLFRGAYVIFAVLTASKMPQSELDNRTQSFQQLVVPSVPH